MKRAGCHLLTTGPCVGATGDRHFLTSCQASCFFGRLACKSLSSRQITSSDSGPDSDPASAVSLCQTTARERMRLTSPHRKCFPVGSIPMSQPSDKDVNTTAHPSNDSGASPAPELRSQPRSREAIRHEREALAEKTHQEIDQVAAEFHAR